MYIYDGRKEFTRWDLNVKIADSTFKVGDEIHFSNSATEEALVVKAYQLNDKVVADVPNILLQTAGALRVMRCTTEGGSEYTAAEQVFIVTDRPKPADYIYIETETEKDDIIEELKAYIDENIFGGEW